jgi:deoxycytidylate deaminase
MHKYLKIATKNALAYEYDDHLEYHLCAVIARGGNIMSIGYNKRNTNGFVEHYTDKVRGTGRSYSLSTHAEMDAVAQARSKSDLRGCKIYVARIRKPDQKSVVGLARPCSICQNILHAYGIRRAYYTIDDDNYGVMRVVQRDVPMSNEEIRTGS